MHQLKKKGFSESGSEKGTHQLTAKAKAQLGGALALPAPAGAQVAHGPAGRAKPGSGNIVLRAALDAGPLTPIDLRKRMAAQGMSPKSVSGVLARAKDGGLIRKNGTGYELTAKGQKIELQAVSHG